MAKSASKDSEMTPPRAVRAPQCSACREGQPYVCCPKRDCALQAMVERRGNQARRALVTLIGMLDDCDMEAGMTWTRRDRREFLKMAGMTEYEYKSGI
jgi:hypothetical protein